MQIIDVSVPVRPGMITYPGDPEVRLERVSSIGDGDVVNLSRLDLGVHSGTHVDAPLHFVDGGASVETLPLDVLVGPCVIVDGLDVAAAPRDPRGTGPICFAILRSRSPATFNVHPRTPRVAGFLGPRLARNLTQYH